MPAFDLFVVVLVATVTIALNLMAAVAVGVAIAVASFLLRMSRSVIRRSYRGNVVRSHRTRAPALMELLASEGRRIVVFDSTAPSSSAPRRTWPTASRPSSARTPSW